MKKATMLATLVAGLAMGITAAVEARPQRRVNKALDTEIIVEVDRSLESLTKVGIKNTQNIVRNRIRSYVTTNFRDVESFSVLNNAFAIAINSDYVDLVRKVPGVKNVTINEAHWVTYADQNDGAVRNSTPEAYGGSENVSAVTMQKPGANETLPGTTNDGEGTLIAILDNEFYLRAEHTEGEDVVESWCHETFTKLDDSVSKRADYLAYDTPGATPEEIAASKAAYLEWVGETRAAVKHSTSSTGDGLVDYDADPNKAEKVKNTPLGKEGSLYFNSKVPFYFDYGGEKTIHSDYISHDFDVSSTITYHGSHVASIASGNADTYKGIAPKAQLVLMKVFTNFKPGQVEEAVGLQASTGAYDIPILRALEDCMILGVDGINMSLGSNLNDFDNDSITCKTLSRLADEGILTSIAAGNSGKSAYGFAGGYGSWTFDMAETGILSSYTDLENTTVVASGQPTRKFFQNAFKMGDAYVEFEDQIVNRDGMPDDYDIEHEMKEVFDDEHQTREWVYVPGFGTDGDYAGLDVSGKIAVVNRGSTTFSSKYAVAHGHGAIAMVVINNDPTASSFNFRLSFGDDQPEIPVALVLYSDIDKFGIEGSSDSFSLIKDEVAENVKAYTTSTYSSDGATFDLHLKPEITTPGENIRGAIPPQKKEDRETRPLSTYEFLSGTSMAAPNYAGAQSVILSKEAKGHLARMKAIEADNSLTAEEKAAALAEEQRAYEAYRHTIDMRLMSTARIMSDYDYDPEVYYNSGASHTKTYQYTSPRIQGSGMTNIGAAYNTQVYLEGLDAKGNGIGKAKVELKNTQLVNEGTIAISFKAHNESESSKTYGAKLVVMRPAVEHNTDIVTKEYNDQGSVDSISNFPGRKYYEAEYTLIDGQVVFSRAEEHMSVLGFNVNDVYEVKKAIKYWATENDCKLDHPSEDQSTWTEDHMTTIEPGRYYVAQVIEEKDGQGNVISREAVYLPLEPHAYQSVQDTLIAEVTLDDVVIPAGESTVNLAQYNLTTAQKEAIAEYYEYGCYLEGYVLLDSRDDNDPDLNMPFLGYYGGENGDYESAPVVEPFSFEKDASKVYPSDLVNDIGKSLLGKSNIDYGSEWITTYLEPGQSFYSDKILENDESLSHLCEMDSAYHLVGTDVDGVRYDHASDNIYVGSPKTSNTMIMQQFVLRSCADNNFTITNEKGELVYKDALQDMLFGDTQHKWTLYKSHVDDTYLGAGYVAHRAFAVIPLYDAKGESFPSGNYTITFNYQLSATGNWVSKEYHFIIDSDAPTVKNVKEDSENIRINITESNLVRLSIGQTDYTSSIQFEQATGEHYVTISKIDAIRIMNENINRENGTGRLFVGMTDKAYGYTGAIIKFNKKDKKASAHYGEDFARQYRFIPLFNNYTIAEHYTFESRNDLEDLGGQINYFTLDYRGNPSALILDDYIKVTRYPEKKSQPASKGCGGNVLATSITLSALAGVLAIVLVASKSKKKLGGQE